MHIMSMRNRIVKCWFCSQKAKYFPTVHEGWGSWLSLGKYTCRRCTRKLELFSLNQGLDERKRTCS